MKKKLIFTSLFILLLTSCGFESVPVVVLVNGYAPATVAKKVVISINGSSTEYTQQPGQSRIELGHISVGTKIAASVTSEENISMVSIIIDNCFRDNGRCDEPGCTATAEYVVQIEECINY